MMLKQHILSYGLFLLVSAATILSSYRLKKRFTMPFLRLFFSFITLYCLSNFLSMTSKLFYSSLSLEKTGLFSLMIAVILIPLLISVFYALLLLSETLTEKKYPNWVKGVFWATQAVASVCLLITVSMITDTCPHDFLFLALPIYIIIAILSLAVPSAVMAFRNAGGRDRRSLTLSRTLGLYFMIAFIVIPILIEFFAIPSRWFYSLFAAYNSIFIMMAAIPIPPLVFLTVYLKKHQGFFFVDGALLTDLDTQLSRFSLTPRELDIVRLVLEGKTNREIGDQIFISTKTVKNNITEIFKKLQVENRVQMVGFLFGENVKGMHDHMTQAGGRSRSEKNRTPS